MLERRDTKQELLLRRAMGWLRAVSLGRASTRGTAKPLEKLQPSKKYIPPLLCVRRSPASRDTEHRVSRTLSAGL